MKQRIILILAAAAIGNVTTSVMADSPTTLNEGLKSIEFIVGDWLLEFEDGEGRKHAITKNIQPDARGSVIRSVSKWEVDGKVWLSWLRIYYPQGSAQQIKATEVWHSGEAGSGQIAFDEKDGMVVANFEGTNKKDDRLAFREEISAADEDTLTFYRVTSVNGKSHRGTPGTFHRVKSSSP